MMNLWFAAVILGPLLAAPAYTNRPVQIAALSPVDAIDQAENDWSYSVRQSDAALAVRRKAEHRALQRSLRITASRWYGHSNSRPVVSSTPWGGVHHSLWASGLSRPRFIWNDGSWPVYYVYSNGSLGR